MQCLKRRVPHADLLTEHAQGIRTTSIGNPPRCYRKTNPRGQKIILLYTTNTTHTFNTPSTTRLFYLLCVQVQKCNTNRLHIDSCYDPPTSRLLPSHGLAANALHLLRLLCQGAEGAPVVAATVTNGASL